MKASEFPFRDKIPGEIISVDYRKVDNSLDEYTVQFIDEDSGDTVTGVFEAEETWAAEGWGYDEKSEDFVRFERVA